MKTYGDIYRSRGYLAGDDATRAEELMAAFADPETAAVWCARGGYGVVRLLERIDFDVIRRNPKVFVGFSDITVLHIAIQQRTGLVTFHGPNLQDGFGKPDDMPAANEAALWRAVMADRASRQPTQATRSTLAASMAICELRPIRGGVATGPADRRQPGRALRPDGHAVRNRNGRPHPVPGGCERATLSHRPLLVAACARRQTASRSPACCSARFRTTKANRPSRQDAVVALCSKNIWRLWTFRCWPAFRPVMSGSIWHFRWVRASRSMPMPAGSHVLERLCPVELSAELAASAEIATRWIKSQNSLKRPPIGSHTRWSAS